MHPPPQRDPEATAEDEREREIEEGKIDVDDREFGLTVLFLDFLPQSDGEEK